MILRSRSSVSQVRAIAVAAMAAALIPAVAGCEAGANAPTQRWHQPTPGASAVVDGTLRLNNVFVLGPAPTATLAPGTSAGMFLAISNNGSADRLLSISAPGTARAVRLPGGGVTVGAQRSVFWTGPQPRVILEGLTRSLAGGQFIRVVLDFQRAGQVQLNVPVMPYASDYATFSPAPAPPSPTPSSTAKGRKTAAPSASPSAASTGAPSPTPSPSPTG